MSDIVERLRDPTSRWVALSEPDPLRLEAADEIERLRADAEESCRIANRAIEDAGRLKAALQGVINRDPKSIEASYARAALEGKP